MANLQNKKIFQTYKSIVGIGSSGTSGVTSTPQALTDGLGVEIPLEVSDTEVNVTAETLKVRSLTVDGYGEVINSQGEWLGVGAAGSSGTSGTSGATGPTGPIGPSGSQGTSGSAGSSGTSGSSGTRGTSGTSGSSGSSGTRGAAGTSGTSGTSGLNGDRYLTSSTTTLSVSTGTKTLTVGLGLSYSVAQKVLIAYSGSIYMEGTIISYNPASGAMIANITSAVGSSSYSFWTVNLAGASGGDGSSGTSGTSGTSGINGTSGTSGVNGTSGTSGVSGTDGSSGTSGSSGSTGTSGTSGTSGIDGSSGTSGIDGTSGTSGIDGSSGTSGVDGTNGSSGTSGSSGTTGTSGTSGLGYPVNGQILSLTNNTIGATGTFVFNLVSPYTSTNFAFASGQYIRAIQQVDAGLNWMEGVLQVTGPTEYTLYVDNYDGSGSYNKWSFAISGEAGSNGTSGTSGTSGINGTSGTSGSNGSSGTAGTSGSSGTRGTSGTSGTSGANGTSGTSGSSGIVTSLNSVLSTPYNGSISTNLYTAPKMLGMAVSFTPNSTGKVHITLDGQVNSGTTGKAAWIQARYGTGTAPSNNAALTGTQAGGTNTQLYYNSDTANQIYSLTVIISGLTPNTTYWFDLGVQGVGSNVFSPTSMDFTNSQMAIFEMAGVQGPAGTSGSVGTSGTSGVSGSSGTSGQDGTFFGSSGTSGSSGLTGTSGTSGISGSSGTSGVNGTSGTSGISGSSGTSGYSGVNGSNGTSGTSGISGSSGTSGATGATGSNGTSGTSGANGADTSILPISTKTSNYSLVVSDAGSLIEMNSGTAKTISVPLDAAQNFTVGSQIVLVRAGVGSVSVVATTGVTINAANGYLSLYSQYSSATLVKKAANTWYLFGDLKA